MAQHATMAAQHGPAASSAYHLGQQAPHPSHSHQQLPAHLTAQQQPQQQQQLYLNTQSQAHLATNSGHSSQVDSPSHSEFYSPASTSYLPTPPQSLPPTYPSSAAHTGHRPPLQAGPSSDPARTAASLAAQRFSDMSLGSPDPHAARRASDAFSRDPFPGRRGSGLSDQLVRRGSDAPPSDVRRGSESYGMPVSENDGRVGVDDPCESCRFGTF